MSEAIEIRKILSYGDKVKFEIIEKAPFGYFGKILGLNFKHFALVHIIDITDEAPAYPSAALDTSEVGETVIAWVVDIRGDCIYLAMRNKLGVIIEESMKKFNANEIPIGMKLKVEIAFNNVWGDILMRLLEVIKEDRNINYNFDFDLAPTYSINKSADWVKPNIELFIPYTEIEHFDKEYYKIGKELTVEIVGYNRTDGSILVREIADNSGVVL